MGDSQKDFAAEILKSMKEYFKPMSEALDDLTQRVKSIDKNKVVDDIFEQVKERFNTFQENVQGQFSNFPPQHTLKPDISWPEANDLMHSFATILDPESRTKFYDSLAKVRGGNPQEVTEAVLAFIAKTPKRKRK